MLFLWPKNFKLPFTVKHMPQKIEFNVVLSIEKTGQHYTVILLNIITPFNNCLCIKTLWFALLHKFEATYVPSQLYRDQLNEIIR